MRTHGTAKAYLATMMGLLALIASASSPVAVAADDAPNAAAGSTHLESLLIAHDVRSAINARPASSKDCPRAKAGRRR